MLGACRRVSWTNGVDITEGEVGYFKRDTDGYPRNLLRGTFSDSAAGGGAGEGICAVSAAAAWIVDRMTANPVCCVGELAQMRILEMVVKQFEKERVMTAGEHPGAVLTEMAFRDAHDELKQSKLMFCLFLLEVDLKFHRAVLLILGLSFCSRKGGSGRLEMSDQIDEGGDLVDSVDLYGAVIVYIAKDLNNTM